MKTSAFDPKRLMIAMTVLVFGCSNDITAPVDPSSGDTSPDRNQLQPAIRVSYPDLAITRMVERTLKGNMKSVEITVTNKGASLYGDVQVSLGKFYDEAGTTWLPSKTVKVFLASGASFKVTFESTTACGYHLWTGYVDQVGAWRESNDANNGYSIAPSCP